MISASFSYLISASEEAHRSGRMKPPSRFCYHWGLMALHSADVSVYNSDCSAITVSTLLLSGCTAAVDLLCKQAAHLKAAST